MPTINNGASFTVTLPAGQQISTTGTGVATLGPGPSANLQIGLQGSNVIGPYGNDQAVYLTGTSALSYAVGYPITSPSAADLQLNIPEVNWVRSSVSGGDALKLRRWRAALGKAVAGTARARVLFGGDSQTRGVGASGASYAGNQALAYPTQLAALAGKRLAAVNMGSSFGDTNVTIANHVLYDPRWSAGAGWTTQLLGGGLGGAPISHNAANTNALNFAPAAQFDSIKVWYLTNPGFQAFTVAVDGGAALGTITPTAANSFTSTTLTTTLGTHTINIAKTAANAAAVHIVGIETWNSAAKGVEFLNCGLNGSKTADWITSLYYQAGQQTLSLAPDLVVFMIGANDWGLGTDPTVYAANLQTYITATLAVSDMIIVGPPPTQVGWSGFSELTRQAAMIDAARSAAAANNIPFVDVNARAGTWAQANASGLYFDGAHPLAAEYADVAAAIYPVIFS